MELIRDRIYRTLLNLRKYCLVFDLRVKLLCGYKCIELYMESCIESCILLSDKVICKASIEKLVFQLKGLNSDSIYLR